MTTATGPPESNVKLARAPAALVLRSLPPDQQVHVDVPQTPL